MRLTLNSIIRKDNSLNVSLPKLYSLYSIAYKQDKLNQDSQISVDPDQSPDGAWRITV